MVVIPPVGYALGAVVVLAGLHWIGNSGLQGQDADDGLGKIICHILSCHVFVEAPTVNTFTQDVVVTQQCIRGRHTWEYREVGKGDIE